MNVAAPFLLTGELLDLVTERIVNVSSISMADSLDFEDLQQVQGAGRGGCEGFGHVLAGSHACLVAGSQPLPRSPAAEWHFGCGLQFACHPAFPFHS